MNGISSSINVQNSSKHHATTTKKNNNNNKIIFLLFIRVEVRYNKIDYRRIMMKYLIFFLFFFRSSEDSRWWWSEKYKLIINHIGRILIEYDYIIINV